MQYFRRYLQRIRPFFDQEDPDRFRTILEEIKSHFQLSPEVEFEILDMNL